MKSCMLNKCLQVAETPSVCSCLNLNRGEKLTAQCRVLKLVTLFACSGTAVTLFFSNGISFENVYNVLPVL